MGRKIPAKKHRGVKDPIAQQAKRWQSLKGKINAPPKDPDEQPMPRSLIRLFGLEDPKMKVKEKQKKHILNSNPSSKSGNSVGHKKERNPVAQLRRLPGESGRSFSLRINGAVRTLNDSAEELHYPADMEDDDDVKGTRMEEQRRRRERKRRRQPAAGSGTGDDTEPAKLTRGQRLTLRKKEKKLKQAETARTEAREVVYERVGFGEVAHAPPTLRPHRKQQQDGAGAPRPGRRDLLLTRMLTGGAGAGAAAGARAGTTPAAEKRRLERARQEAVDAYRALKGRPQPPTVKI